MRGGPPRPSRLQGALAALALGGCGLLWAGPRRVPATGTISSSTLLAFLRLQPWAPSSTAAATPRTLEGGAPLLESAQRWRRRQPRASVAAAAEAGTGAGAAEAWLDCDLRFTAEEARVQEINQLREQMTEAAQAMQFERAQGLKLQMEAKLAAAPPEPAPPETWLLPSSQFAAFGRFLTNRGVEPKDVEIGCEPEPSGAAAWGSRTCQECVKLNTGGPYGKAGVVSPAYPPQEQALGCLGLSATLDVDLSAYQGTGDGALSDESYDASEAPKSVAFCRVL